MASKKPSKDRHNIYDGSLPILRAEIGLLEQEKKTVVDWLQKNHPKEWILQMQEGSRQQSEQNQFIQPRILTPAEFAEVLQTWNGDGSWADNPFWKVHIESESDTTEESLAMQEPGTINRETLEVIISSIVRADSSREYIAKLKEGLRRNIGEEVLPIFEEVLKRISWIYLRLV